MHTWDMQCIMHTGNLKSVHTHTSLTYNHMHIGLNKYSFLYDYYLFYSFASIPGMAESLKF